MEEGYWIRMRDDKAWEIYDHAGDFAENPKLAKKMGLMDLYNNLIVKKGIKPEGREGKKRRQIVLAIMNEGFIRVRGHGMYVTFEFTDSASIALDNIYLFGKKNFGDYTNLNIAQLTKEGKARDTNTLTWSEFLDRYESDKQQILKTAKVITRRGRL